MNNRVFVFIGSFIFGLSIILIILGMLFAKDFLPDVQNDHYEIFLGWFGATVIAGGMALKMYMDGSSGYGNQDGQGGDSVVSFVSGLSLTLYALLATWLWIIEVPPVVLGICLISSAMSFIGIIMIAYFMTASEY